MQVELEELLSKMMETFQLKRKKLIIQAAKMLYV
jgi:hypothetical protein